MCFVTHLLLNPQAQSQSLRSIRPTGGSLRRHTEPGQLRTRAALGHFRRLASIVTVALAIIRLKSLREKRVKKGREAAAEESVPPTPTTPTATCRLCDRTHDISNAPDVVWRRYLHFFEFMPTNHMLV